MIGQKIRDLRKANNMSQKALAATLDLTQSTIANYEKNMRQPNLEILVKLSEVLETSVDNLLGIDKSADKKDIWSLNQIQLSDHLLDLLLADQTDIAQLFLEEYLIRFDIENLNFKLLRHVLTKLGWLWEVGLVTISKEHQISRFIEKYIDQVTLEKSLNHNKKKVVVGMTVLGEKHTLGLKMLLKHLQIDGYRTFDIGEGVPIDDFLDYLKSVSAEIIILSTTTPGLQKPIYDYLNILTPYRVILVGMGVDYLKDSQTIEMYKNYKTCLEALK